MTRSEVCSAVAHATGESVQTIRRRGFGLLALMSSVEALDIQVDDGMTPQSLDWDDLQRSRQLSTCAAMMPRLREAPRDRFSA